MENNRLDKPPKKKQKTVTGSKRTRNEMKSTNNNSVNYINENEISTMSSKALEEYIKAIPRALTLSEEKTLKKQKRLIKNRESAQASRQKKKQYVEDLERNYKNVSEENERLRTTVETLSQKVTHLENCLRENRNNTENSIQSPTFNQNTAKLGAVFTFVILFSFGLFFVQNPVPQAPLELQPQK